MSYKRQRKSYPKHPFTYLINGKTNPKNKHLNSNPTPAQKNIVNHLKKGARLVFDVKEKRGLIYNFKKGINAIMEITTRTLAQLIKKGYVKLVSKEDKLIHFIWMGADEDWFLPEAEPV